MAQQHKERARAAEAEANAISPGIPHVGTYRRQLPVSLDRLYENALDWEHLPFLHRSTFSQIEGVDAAAWGWRAWVWPQPAEGRKFLLELRLDRERGRWVSATLEGTGAGTEIWTQALAIADRQTDIVVDFYAPGVSPKRVGRIGEYYRTLYARLYDEDVWMMTERQRQLDSIGNRPAAPPAESVVLGRFEDLRRRLPILVELGGREFRVVEDAGELLVHATVCPHLLGPLREAAVNGGIIECPWHGYRFDLRTRRSVRGNRCSLAPAPAIRLDRETGQVTLEWGAAADRASVLRG